MKTLLILGLVLTTRIHAIGIVASVKPTPEDAGVVKIDYQVNYGEDEYITNLHALEVTTLDGTAFSHLDFQPFSGNVPTEPGNISLPILNDDIAEPTETFQVRIRWQQNNGPTAFLWQGPVLLNVTILDDDSFTGVMDLPGDTTNVVMDDNYLAVAHLIANPDSNSPGRVHIHDRRTGAFIREISPPSDWLQPGDFNIFGSSLAIDNGCLLIGGKSFYQFDNAYLFDLATGDLIRTIPASWQLWRRERGKRYQLAGDKLVVVGTIPDSGQFGVTNSPAHTRVYSLTTDQLLFDEPGRGLGVSESKMAFIPNTGDTLTLYNLSQPETVTPIRTIDLPETVITTITGPASVRINAIRDIAVAGDHVIVSAMTAIVQRENDPLGLNRRPDVLWFFDLSPSHSATPIYSDTFWLGIGETAAYYLAAAEDGTGARAFYYDTDNRLIILDDTGPEFRRYGAGTSPDNSHVPIAFKSRFIIDLPYDEISRIRVNTFEPAKLALVDGETWEGSGPHQLSAVLEEVRLKPITFDLQTHDGSAVSGIARSFDSFTGLWVARGDYLPLNNQSHTIPPGTRSVGIPIAIVDEQHTDWTGLPPVDFSSGLPLHGAAAVEEDESFTISAHNITQGIATSIATVTIHDNDAFSWWQAENDFPPR